MIRYTRFFIILLLAAIAFGANAQSTATTSSPYSRYGLGDITPALLPQNIGMGGIATATNRISGYNSINPLNPASYGTINLTTIDIGLYSNFSTLSKTGNTDQQNSNFRLSHLAFGIPVTKRSALSFGLLPYSQLGYNYKQTLNNFGTGLPADTNKVNYIYTGDGGLSRGYLGYGFGIGKHLLVGANVSYIFGNLKQYKATEIPDLYGTLNTKIEESNSVGGFNYDLGLQYSFDFSDVKHLIFGYSISTASKLNTQNSYIVSQYSRDANGNENNPLDSVVSKVSPQGKIQLPNISHFGVSFQTDGRFIVGADYTIGKWSSLSIAGVNAGLQDSKTLNVGGQYTPNINSFHYLSTVDYRLGFIYDQTYLNVNNTNITRYAATFGLGLPLSPNITRTTFYKVNISAEVGRRGTLANGLVKESYLNLRVAFTLNDRWFQRYRFE